MTDLFYWCATCGRVSILAEGARFGFGVSPYVCPGCAIEEGGKITIPPDTNDLRPYSEARKERSNFPVVPTRGQTYPMSGESDFNWRSHDERQVI